MKIGIACTNAIPIPVPKNEIYANQAIAGWIADELSARGHDVTLFAPAGSRTSARLVTFDMLPYSDPSVYGYFNTDRSFADYEELFLAKVYNYAEKNRFDILHMHLRPLSVAPLAAMSKVPTIQTIHDPLSFQYFRMLERYNEFDNLRFVSISLSQRKALPNLRMFDNVYNGIDLSRWKFDARGGDGLCWSGRVIREKGPHKAMEIAKSMDLPLRMAGFVYERDRCDDNSYFSKKVKPLLGGDIQMEYVGQERLPGFYGRSRAFINTLDWEEPFGLVMVEAMACGTPVITFNRGSAAEIIKDGVTGFVVESEEEMREAIRNAGSISREACRRHVEENFSVEKMADNYLAAYKRLTGQASKH